MIAQARLSLGRGVLSPPPIVSGTPGVIYRDSNRRNTPRIRSLRGLMLVTVGMVVEECT